MFLPCYIEDSTAYNPVHQAVGSSSRIAQQEIKQLFFLFVSQMSLTLCPTLFLFFSTIIKVLVWGVGMFQKLTEG